MKFSENLNIFRTGGANNAEGKRSDIRSGEKSGRPRWGMFPIPFCGCRGRLVKAEAYHLNARQVLSGWMGPFILSSALCI